MSKLVVLTDLGTFKAFRLEDDRRNSTPRLESVDTFENERADDRISRRVTDQAGQFRRAAPADVAAHIQGNGERHNIWLEEERRSLKEIARHISELLNDGEFESCYLAASEEINNAVVDHLTPQARAKIEKNIHKNLVNAQRETILQHFA